MPVVQHITPMERWKEHVATWRNCRECALCDQRYKIVLGRGSVPAHIVFLGEAPGDSENAVGMPFCIREDHRVLMSNLTWKPLGDMQIGDTIIAPDEFGTEVDTGSASGRDSRKWRIATVTAVHRSQQPCVRLVTETGTLVITPDHKVLTAYPTNCKARTWLRVDQLMVGRHRSSCLATVFPPWVKDESYKSGWVGGFLDGEGNVPKNTSKVYKARLAFAQNSGPTCERAKQYISDLGYECRTDSVSTTKNEKVRILGGFRKIIELLGRTRPERLITNFTSWIAKSAPRCYSVQPSKVLEIDRRTRAPQNVVDITTTTGTFICEGFVVHNCGPAGNLLDQVVARSVGAFNSVSPIKLSVAYTNLVACYPREAKEEGTHRPKDSEIEACQTRLREFLDICQPRLIVAVGTLAEDNMPLVLDKIIFSGGKVEGHATIERVVSIVHPSYILSRLPIAQQGMAIQKAIVTVATAIEQIDWN